MIISFLLDGVISNYLNFNSLFTLLIIIFIYKNKNSYLYVLVFGFLFDIVYTDTLFLNTIIFYFCLLITNKIFKYLKYNFINVVFVSILLIIIYRTLIYLELCVIEYIEFDYIVLLNSYLYSLLNVIFVIIIYLIKSWNKKDKKYV